MRRADETGETDAGLSVAKRLVDAGREHAPGFYIMPQMERYAPAAELVRHVKSLTSQARGA